MHQAPLQSEALLRDYASHLVDHLNDVVYVLRSSRSEPFLGQVLFVSEGVRAVFGYEPEAFVDDPTLWFRAIHPDDAPQVAASTAEMYRSCSRDVRRYRLQHGVTRSYRHIEDRVRVLHVTTDLVDVIGVARDVTSEVQQAMVLHNFNARYRRLLETSPHGIVVVCRGGQIVVANRNIEQMLGYERGSLVGQLVETLVPDGLRQLHVSRREAFTNSPRTRPMGESTVLAIRHRDGRTIPVDIGLALIEDLDGEPLVRCSVHDLRPRIELESRLRRAEKMEAIGRLAGGVAHDFNNLLTAILGHGEYLLEETRLDSQQRAEVDGIVRATRKAADLTARLMTFGGRQKIEARVFDVNGLIQDLSTMLRRMLGSGVRLTMSLAPMPMLVLADQGAMQLALLNLVVNARDAMRAGGTVVITTSLRTPEMPLGETRPDGGRYCRITVADTGTGMPSEVLDHIFEPYFTTKEAGMGSGLGLASVHGTLKQFGGYVEVRSEVGVGTEFALYLPQANDQPT